MAPPVRAVASIEAFLIIFGISAMFILMFAGDWIIATILLFVAGILSLALSVPAAALRRNHHVNFIKQQINSASAYGRPHIVAHSLGTYLIGRVLAKFHEIELGNVVLVSSVLPSTYPWANLLEERPECVLNVRNELGTADRVTRLVGKIQWLVPELGASGVGGFDGPPSVIHTSKSALAACDQCVNTSVKVHNVPLKEYGHSTEFLGDGHARKLCLPFLWGYSSAEFLRYLEMCQRAARFQQDGRFHEVDDIIAKLGRSVFAWTNNKRVVDYVKDVVTAHLKRKRLSTAPATVDELTEATMDVLHVMAHEACLEVAKQDPIDENVARGLHPRIAINKAVETIIRREHPSA
jgi:hypothetical protein